MKIINRTLVNEAVSEKFGYRDDCFFGEGYRKLDEVIRHETFTLENIDIPDTLINWCKEDADKTALEELINSDDLASEDIPYYMEVMLKVIHQKYPNAKYCLWLCDSPKTVWDIYLKNFNYKDMESALNDISKYRIEHPEPIADLGFNSDGCLFVYDRHPDEYLVGE